MPQPIDIARLMKTRCARMFNPFFGFKLACEFRTANCLSSGFKRNEAWEGSGRTTKCERSGAVLTRPSERQRNTTKLPLLHLADFLHRRDQACRVLGDEF